MSLVDLSNFVTNLQREVDPPGTNNFPAATDDEWIGNLVDAFWEARLDGLLQGYTCDENGVITPINQTNDPASNPGPGTQGPNTQNWSADGQTREMVQLVILYAGYRILRNTLRGLQTMFRATAGPVTFEFAQSAGLLVELLRDIITRRDIVLRRLSDLGTTPDYLIDAVIARDLSITNGDTFWLGTGDGFRTYGYQ